MNIHKNNIRSINRQIVQMNCIVSKIRLIRTAMFSKVTQVVACGILLLICMAAVVRRSSSNIDLTEFRNAARKFEMSLMPVQETTVTEANVKKLSDLQALEPAQFSNQSNLKCVNARLGDLSFPMCIYNPEEDIYISKMVDLGGYFEADLVQKMLNLFRTNPNMSFVDLGANLGTYSLPIAHSGFQVISVEPNEDTVRRLATSVNLGRIQNNIDIFHYALSSEESTTFLKFDGVNRGDTFMAENGPCPGCLSAKVTVLNKLLPFMRHKKAFIKIDTQEAEIKIFQRKSAGDFFKDIDVVLIQMEWEMYRSRYGITEEGRRRVDRFLEFFYQRDYDVYDPVSERKLDADWTQWTFNVLFKKESLPKERLYLI